MSEDLISREALKKIVCAKFGNSNLTEAFNEIINNEPTADVVCPECFIRYSQGYLDGITKNPKALYNGIVELISKNGLTTLDELLEILKKGAKNDKRIS